MTITGYILEVCEDSFFIRIKDTDDTDDPYQEFEAEILIDKIAECDKDKIIAGTYIDVNDGGEIVFPELQYYTKEDIQRAEKQAAEWDEFFLTPDDSSKGKL